MQRLERQIDRLTSQEGELSAALAAHASENGDQRRAQGR